MMKKIIGVILILGSLGGFVSLSNEFNFFNLILAIALLAGGIFLITRKKVQKTQKQIVKSAANVVAPTVTPAPQASANEETHKVTGISYRTDAVLSLGYENEDYKLSKKQLIEEGLTEKNIYKYDFGEYNGELVPEPDNPYDPNAIKVLAGGVHIGYIKKGSCAHIKNLMKDDKIAGIKVFIGGGPYKNVYSDDILSDDPEDYEMETETIEYHAKVYIKLK